MVCLSRTIQEKSAVSPADMTDEKLLDELVTVGATYYLGSVRRENLGARFQELKDEALSRMKGKAFLQKAKAVLRRLFCRR